MIPQIDSNIGITAYTTSFAGIGGIIKNAPEDFEVSEVISDTTLKSIGTKPGYAVYVLEKRNIDTAHALSFIMKRTGAKLKALGLKDSSAVTRQYVCSNSKTRFPDDMQDRRFSLERLGFVKKPLSKRNMIGNRFRIKITKSRPGLSDFAEHDRVLNFYGYQRFGARRPVTHLVGEAILRRNFESAVELILSYTSKYDSRGNDIRQKISDKAQYHKYVDLLPPQMDIERIVLRQMVSHGDPQRALRAIPVHLRRFYVQAYQSYLFNRTLSDAFANGEELFRAQDEDVCFDSNGVIGRHAGIDRRLAIPVVGYSYYKNTRFHHYISHILKSEGISPKDFFIKEMQEVSNEGGFRQSAIHCTGYKANNNTVEFTLSRGSFATILLREIIKPADPMMAGF